MKEAEAFDAPNIIKNYGKTYIRIYAFWIMVCISIFFCLLSLISVLFPEQTYHYQMGQIDALEGRIKFELIIDTTQKWEPKK